MEKELNIAAILKDKPLYTKLWSDTFGDMFLTECSVDSFNVKGRDDNLIWTYLSNGTFKKYMGVLSIFPSKAMRSWEKFAWKKGDVLTTKTKSLTVVFDYFNATYESFGAKYSFCSYQEKNEDDAWEKDGENSYKTECFHKVSDEEAKEFIKKIEEHYGAKLNLSTLQIEQPNQKFKDGDIVYLNTKNGLEYVFAYDASKEMITSYIVAYCITLEEFAHIETQYICRDNMINSIHSATDSEKQQLFEALAKEGKRWDAEKKMLVDLPKMCEFKPMDWCLMKQTFSIWCLCQYAFKNDRYSSPYFAIGGNAYDECIPYNDQTAQLIGTTDEWEGGEG